VYLLVKKGARYDDEYRCIEFAAHPD